MRQIALVLGESLVDIVHRRDGSVTTYPGGSAANVAVALARLERPTWFATSYADDEHGRLIADHLGGDGVRLATDPAVISRSSQAVATIGPDGSASYAFDIDWRLGPLTLSDDLAPVAVHACSIGATLAPGADQILELAVAHRGGALVSYDINARPAVTGTGPDVLGRIERLVAISDLVKSSDEDLEALYPGRDHVVSARALLDQGPAAVVVTRGGDGALVLSRHGTVEVPAAPGTVVADTIGAGDTFSAATIDALWTLGVVGPDARAGLEELGPETWRDVLTFAARAAAVTVSRAGADPPRRGELGEV